MKKRWILLILPLMMMVMPVATANGWGLPEALVPLVSNTNDYDDYYHLADDYARKENSARIIMQSRYHNQLIAAEKGRRRLGGRDLFDDRRLSAVGAEHIREAEARAHQ